MTKRGWFLLLTTVALGLPLVWLELRSNEPVAGASSRPATLDRPGEQLGVRAADPPSSAERPADETRRPHPVTPIHEAMARRRELIAALVEALGDKHYEQARALFDEAEVLSQTEPESSTFRGSVRGYQLILDCIAARGAAANGSRELPDDLLLDAREYLEQERLPPRRDVRRVCLEGRAFARRS